jgi:hypothetical protein
MSNLIVKIRAMPVPEKSPPEDKKPKVPMSLEQRVSYALDCIDAEEHNAQQARDFLQKVRHKIADERLQQQVDDALNTEP